MVDIALEGLEAAPIECLLDTGALRTRMSAEIAPLAGIELSGDLTEEFAIAGVKTVGTMARVNLVVTDGTDEFSWDAPVWFCDPWPHPFGLAGLEGFLHHFLVTIHAYHGYLEIEPESGAAVQPRGLRSTAGRTTGRLAATGRLHGPGISQPVSHS